MTARTSAALIADRRLLVFRPSVANAATLALTHPQRAACDSDARSTRCWFRSDDSPTPADRERLCHRSTSATVSLASGVRAIFSAFTSDARLVWSRTVDAAHVSVCVSSQASSALGGM